MTEQEMSANELALMAQFEREYCECCSIPVEIKQNTFELDDDGDYKLGIVLVSYEMWKRAKQQSEQRIEELEAEIASYVQIISEYEFREQNALACGGIV